jgi:OOP family OmpA-OmpF porin
MKLSKDREEYVKAYFVTNRVKPSRIEEPGCGETKPIDDNATAAGRQNNRRVEFTLFN